MKSMDCAITRVSCDLLGITILDSSASSLTEQIAWDLLKETIRLTRIWANRCGRQYVSIVDVENVLKTMLSIGDMNLSSRDTNNCGLDQLVPVPGSSNIYSFLNGDVDVDKEDTEMYNFIPRDIRIVYPVNYGQKNKEYSGPKERHVSVIKETSPEPLPTLRKVSTKSRRSLDLMSAFFVSFFRNRRRSHTFQQDDAAIHSSNFTKNCPGLNPIENLWEMLVPRVYQNRQQYNNIQAFKTAVQRDTAC
uniref:Uncharacterized protein n=1 Tax=Caenorhabditis japonica TaxID=281687 RepID=A0A8R1DJH8_CAEJA